MDVTTWLRGLGLERYAPAFRDNDVDDEVLPALTSDDLISIGVTSVGHRRKLLDAIAGLREIPTAAVTAAFRDDLELAAGTGERRQLTVMFCDVVGSTALSARLDPEDLSGLIRSYQACVATTIVRFNGFVARYVGDGVLIYFGYPQAHEDDAERAVRAALAVIAAIDEASALNQSVRVRIGIATGLVVVGEPIGTGEARQQTAIGETPNRAARLQGLAYADGIVIDEATRRQVGELFALADLGPQALAGFAEPLPAWRVLGESRVVSRFEALRAGTTPLVGRGEELDMLLRRWQQAKSGEGRVVLMSGEPGIGKSRLTAALSEHIGSEPHTRLGYFCSPHHQDSAFYPFIVQLERAAGYARDDTVDAKFSKLRARITPGSRGEDDIALLSELLSLPSSAADLNLSPQLKREKLFEIFLNQLEAEARHRTVLMVFEDAHWIDPTSRELLDLIVDQVQRLPVLLVITFRPEFLPPWAGRSHVMSLMLNRLSGRDGEALVQKLIGNAGITAEIVAEIVERTDGVPLFVEELTKAVLESVAQGDRVAAVLGTASQTALSVPATLHASLMARLDRLGPSAKEIAQIGAVLGREFPYELIDLVAQRPTTKLQAALGQLSEAGLLFCRGVAPHASYLFKHALVQDAAYSTLLRERRQQLHGRVAAALEARFPELVERQPELLAHHYTEANCPAPAIAYWHRAGTAAVQTFANVEAIEQIRRGLQLVEALSEPREQAERELDLQMALGPALVAVKSWSHPDMGRAYARALELCRQLGDRSREFTTLRGLWLYHISLLEMEKAQHLAEEALRVAEELDDATRLVGAHATLGVVQFYRGKLEAALAHFRHGLEMFDPEMQFQDWPGSHPWVICQLELTLISWMLGYPVRSLEELRAAVESAQMLGHPLTLAQTLCQTAFVHIFLGEPSAAADHAEQALRICEEHRIAGVQADALGVGGWARSASGEGEKGLAQIAQAVERYGLGSDQHVLLALQADALLAVGKPNEALASVAAGLKVIEKMGGAQLEAELYRLKGEALFAGAGTVSEAETAIAKGINVARRQNAKSWELRCAMSLAKLWDRQDRRGEAYDLLAPVYGWFTEGLDTADLKGAKALLDTLTDPAIAAERSSR